MALFRKFFYRKPPEGLFEISERVYVFNCCFSTDKLEEDEYKASIRGIVGQLGEHYPDASVTVFNFRDGQNQSRIASTLSEYDITVMDYPRDHESCPLLRMEMIHQFLIASENWLSRAQNNILLMHCEQSGWPVLAFMLASLLLYRKQFSGEQKTLEMVYKQAPRELLQLMPPLNPLPSQIRYLQYVSRRKVGSQWPPSARTVTLASVTLRMSPDFDGESGWRPIFKIYGQDPLMASDQTSKVLFTTLNKRNSIQRYKQEDYELIKTDVHCHIQGDILLECVNLDSGEKEESLFQVMFNTAFIESNTLMLNRDEIDVLRNSTDRIPNDFKVEIIFSEMDATTNLASINLLHMEEKEGISTEEFSKVQEKINNDERLDPKPDVAVNLLQRQTVASILQESLDSDSPQTPDSGSLRKSTLQKVQERTKLMVPENGHLTPLAISTAHEKDKEKENVVSGKPSEFQVSVQRTAQSKIISPRLVQSGVSTPASCSPTQRSPLPISRYNNSALFVVGITALLQDHDASMSEQVAMRSFPTSPVITAPKVKSPDPRAPRPPPSQPPMLQSQSRPPSPPQPPPSHPPKLQSQSHPPSPPRPPLSQPPTRQSQSCPPSPPQSSPSQPPTLQPQSRPQSPLCPPPSQPPMLQSESRRPIPPPPPPPPPPLSASVSSSSLSSQPPPVKISANKSGISPPPPPPPPPSPHFARPTGNQALLPPPPPPPPPPVKNSANTSGPSPPPPPPIPPSPHFTRPAGHQASLPPPPPPLPLKKSASKPGPSPPPPPPLNSKPGPSPALLLSASRLPIPAPPPPPGIQSKNKPMPFAPPMPPPAAAIRHGACNGNIPAVPGPPFALSAKGRGISRMSPRSQSQPRKANLKPYHWLKLTRVMQGSLWAEAQKHDEAEEAPDFDISELESLFSAAAPNSDSGCKEGKSGRRASGPKLEKIQLIELRRAYNCEIMLSKVKIPLPDLMSYVLALDESALDADQVDNLIKFCPTKEETELLKGYTGDRENLGRCEKFFLELIKVPRVESKLRVFSFKIQFRCQVSDLRKSLNIIKSAAEEVRSSIKLKKILQTILSLGNALNHGTARGSAIGFRLDSLLKLTDTRSRNNKMTLMHYLCKVLAEKLPELLDFPKDLASLEGATKIQLKYLAEEMQAISKGLTKVLQELAASENDGAVSKSFCQTLKDFLSFAEGEVRSLASLYSSVGRSADALALYFGEDPARVPFEQVVSTLLNFVRIFIRSHEENCKQLELEKKKTLKEAENSKRKSIAPKRDPDKPRLTTTKNTVTLDK